MNPDLTSTRRPLRILMIAPTSYFADYGCHVRILEEVRALTRHGHRVIVCTYHNGNDIPGMIIRRSIDVPWRKRVIVGSSRHKLYLDAALSVTSLRTALMFRPDVIHAHLHEGALIGGTLARLLRRPLIFDYQGSLTEEMLDHGFVKRDGPLVPWLRRLERRIDRLPHTIITSSDNARQRLLRSRPADRLVTVLDAVDTDRFAPDALTPDERINLRHQLGIPDEREVIVYLGLLAPYQGSDLLLRAARTIADARPNAFFLLMGFPGVEQYQRQAEQLGLSDRVSFPGRIPYPEAHRYLALGDIAVAPKMSLTEGNGKIYNYMAMGLPVVAFDAEPNREILGDLGIYAGHGDEADFAAKVIDLLQNREYVQKLGAELRAHAVEALSWNARAHELLAVYDRVLKRGVADPAATFAPVSARRASTDD
ncbi:MAG TPA: glycosyltransferase family 4 protein [Nitrolancea sp.]|nr:glycosyltransferase family 4 protein [Nitrolancea sp.]